jgi:hypothetical protein
VTFTWSATDLSTDLAQVRHLTGDTVSTDPYLTDEQITHELAQTDDVNLAAANCCLAILALLARRIDRNAQGFSAQRSQLTQHYQDLEKRLRERAGTMVQPRLLGVSSSERDAATSNPDFEQPTFTVGAFDNE